MTGMVDACVRRIHVIRRHSVKEERICSGRSINWGTQVRGTSAFNIFFESKAMHSLDLSDLDCSSRRVQACPISSIVRTSSVVNIHWLINDRVCVVPRSGGTNSQVQADRHLPQFSHLGWPPRRTSLAMYEILFLCSEWFIGSSWRDTQLLTKSGMSSLSFFVSQTR